MYYSLLFISWNSNLFAVNDVEKVALFLEQLALAVVTGKTKDTELPDIFRDFLGK
jgi:hypothetical protein